MMLVFRTFGKLCLTCVLCLVVSLAFTSAQPSVRPDDNGKLNYAQDEQGNAIPDFSYCGYDMASSDIPQVTVRVVVKPADGDDGERIQTAIDYVADLPKDSDGYRGAVGLAPGEFQVAGQILIRTSGVVLQGSGANKGGTTVLATGQDRRALIKVMGVDDRTIQDEPGIQEIRDDYVNVGAYIFNVGSADSFAVGDSVLITRPSTAEWIQEVGGRAEGIGWKPGSRDIYWDRKITQVDEDSITVDAPITTALEKHFGGGTVHIYDWPGRLQHVGIEDVCLQSSYSEDNPKDEDHSWFGITMDNVQNAWVRRTTFEHFAGGAVSLGRNTKSITVEDCISLAPISEIGGYRRHTFFTLGQLTLFNRCWSESGRHDFSVGHCAPGPNAFVQCHADRALGESGPIESWASGVLYDNVRIDGSDLQLQNRWNDPPGTGWAAANCLLWQCRAANVRCFRPPDANNWTIGAWATPAGDGVFESLSDFVKPQSLYQAQLRQRLDESAAARLDLILGKPIAATNPSYQEAAHFLEQSELPAKQLVDLIEDNIARATEELAVKFEAGELNDAVDLENLPNQEALQKVASEKEVSVENGWLVANGQLITGKRLTPTWWRGKLHPEEAESFGHNISRFVPGREGVGLTEDIQDVVEDMVAKSTAVYEHHYGLWYDRRRDDHLMVRRADGAVAPPFYEQPFARSGQGLAWDGLSKYDLTKENPWYWHRLKAFAQQCEENGLVLVHQNYFQHNILEAGAHWADCPWRPANNINETGLPEPPPYIGDKRLFMAQHFYDVANPNLRELHRRYIRQCLDAFKDRSNVIQMTSAEFTGPLEFVQFWIDTIVEWEQETGNKILLGLSCTKDVQDVILADPERGPHVDIIDIRYWTYDKDFKLYAPEGGKYLAPRQHMRQMRPQASSFDSIVKAVSEYRSIYPEKVVLYNADLVCRSPNAGWAVVMGGGSLPNVSLPPELAREAPRMLPVDNVVKGNGQWSMASQDGDLLVYTETSSDELAIDFATNAKTLRLRWIDTETGEIVEDTEIRSEKHLELSPKSKAIWISEVKP